MAHSRRGPLAVGRLQVLCDQAGDSNLFATAVDGLLNLNATPAALRVARRDAVLRVAARPHEMMLYHVLSDLSDEMKDPAAAVRATDAGVSVGDEERSQHLSELMDLACQQGLVDTAVDCGRSLLALDDDFPPQLFLQLGEQLLVAGRQSDAERAFLRAADGSDPDLIAPRVSDLYDRYGYRTAARDALAAIADHHRLDVQLAETLARLDETVGADGPAFDFYLAAAKAADRELPTGPEAGDAAPGTARGGFTPTPPQVTSFDRLIAGAVTTARTPDRRAALVDWLQSRLRDRVAAAADAAGPTADVATVAAALRRVGFATVRPDVADAADAAVIARWPDAKGYAAQAVDQRLRNELVEQAIRFAAVHQVVPSPALRSAQGLAGPAPTTLPTTYSLEQAAEALPPLVVRGDWDAARQVLAEIPPDRPRMGGGPGPRAGGRNPLPVRTVVAAAAAVGEPEVVTRWSLLWLDAIDPSGPTPAALVPQRYTAAIDGTWRCLPPEGRSRFVDRIAQQAAAADGPDVRAALSSFALRLAAELPAARPDAVRLAMDSLPAPTPHGRLSAAELNYALLPAAERAFAFVPAADRPQAISLIGERLPAEVRLSFLFIVVAQAAEPFDAATASAVVRAAAQVPAGQTVDWTDWFYTDWFCNAAQRAVLPALAEAALRSGTVGGKPAGDDPAVLAAAAVALSVAGDVGRADELAARAVTALRALPPPPVADPADANGPRRIAGPGGTPPPGRFALLRTALSAASAEGRARLEAAPDGGGNAPSDRTATGSAVRAVLLDAVGRRSDALDLLRGGFARTPADPDLLRLYLERLQDDRRSAEIVGPVAARVGTADGGRNVIRYAVARGLQDLFRGQEVHDEYPGKRLTPDLATPAATGDVAGLASALREVLQIVRTPNGSPRVANPPNPGGLSPWTPSAPDQPPAALDGFASWPGALDGVMLALQTPVDASTDGDDPIDYLTANWLAALATRAAGDADVRDRIVQRLRAAADTLTRGDRLLVMDLAVLPGVELPPPLVDALRPAALCDASGGEGRRLAAALAAQHLPGADAVARWADAVINSASYSVRAGIPPVEPTPVDPTDDAGVVAWLSTTFAADPAAGERTLAAWRDDGRVTPRFTGCQLLWARYAAERGDVPAFQARLDEALQGQAWQRVVPRTSFSSGAPAAAAAPPDVGQGLPAAVADPARRTALLDAVARSLSGVSARWPADTDVARQWAAAGQWAARQGDAAAAGTMLVRAEALAQRQGPGEHQLWVADLAREVGEDALADRLERGLLDERCLPATRIAPLLRRLQRQGDAGAASRLARDAAAYCREPNVMALADQRPAAR